MLSHIEQSILTTLKFYDLFEFPMTNAELYDFLWGIKCELHEFDRALSNLVRQNEVKFYHGFYFLPERAKLVQIREERYLASFRKWQIIKRWRWIFGCVPFIKMIGISNTLGYSNAKEEGDIDLLVVTQKNRLFISRSILTIYLWLIGKWRHSKRIKNRFCLSFYLSENNLDLNNLKTREDDIYLIYWIKWFKPIWCTEKKVSKNFIDKNSWIKKYLPNIAWINQISEEDSNNWWGKFSAWVLSGKLGDSLEKNLKNWQLNKIRKNTANFSKDGIMAKADILKFHPEGKREEYYQSWRKA